MGTMMTGGCIDPAAHTHLIGFADTSVLQACCYLDAARLPTNSLQQQHTSLPGKPMHEHALGSACL